MKQLNNKSTHIFLKLLKKMGENDRLQIDLKEVMPLSLEFLQIIYTDAGEGKLYSLAQSYFKNGARVYEPEMRFIVVSDPVSTVIYPQMYQQDSMGLYEESVHLEGTSITGSIPLWQASHCAFANIWLKNILAQGFLSK